MVAVLRLPITEDISNVLLQRYRLVDAIRQYRLGKIISEGLGEGKMEVVVEIVNDAQFEQEIKLLLESLGLLDTEISYKDF